MHRPVVVALAMMVMSGMNSIAAASDIFSFSEMQLRATVAGMPSSAAYLKITNNGVSDDRLIAAKATIAQRVEIHSMEMDQGVMRMRAVDGGLAIAAGDSVTLAPGGLHIMLMGLTTDLAPDSQHEIILVFEKAGDIKLTGTAKRPADIMMNMPGHDASHNQDHSKKSQ
ncbi:MAG: copper chaperone PCu(A)C [Proteobacteria bacterium]|nr:copper chaperone PCu(A)C [Pseudomonadota bacterium]